MLTLQLEARTSRIIPVRQMTQFPPPPALSFVLIFHPPLAPSLLGKAAGKIAIFGGLELGGWVLSPNPILQLLSKTSKVLNRVRQADKQHSPSPARSTRPQSTSGRSAASWRSSTHSGKLSTSWKGTKTRPPNWPYSVWLLELTGRYGLFWWSLDNTK